MDIMLDTSAYSLMRRNHSEAARAIRFASKILMSPIVVGELSLGFISGRRQASNEAYLERFLEFPRVELVEVGLATAERYARIHLYLRQQGKPIPTNDIWIAASAMEHSAELITADKHFDFIPHIITKQLVLD